MADQFFRDTLPSVNLFKKLVNAAKTNNFSNLEEPLKSIFITELEKVRSFIDKLIKQPAYMSGWRKRLANETPDDIERRILNREFSITGEDVAAISDMIDKYTLKNLDYYKFLWILGDVYASLRTIVLLRKDITNPYIQPLEYVEEYHKSFGFDIFNEFTHTEKRALLTNELRIFKKKGTIEGFEHLIKSLGIWNFGVIGYWVDLDEDDNTYKLFPKLITTSGNPTLFDFDTILTKAIDDIDDPHWMLTNSDLHTLSTSGETWFPSRSPYITLFLSLNLLDFTQKQYNAILGAIIQHAVVNRNENYGNNRNIPIFSFDNSVSISEAVLAITYMIQRLYGWVPFTSPDHVYMYGYNGDLDDGSGNPLDDDTLVQQIISKWDSVFSTLPTNYDEKWQKINLFRNHFYSQPTWLIVDNITNLVSDALQTRYPEFYNFINQQILLGNGIQLLNEILEDVEEYLYDVSGIVFPLRQYLFGFGSGSPLAKTLKNVFNWNKPYHVKLLDTIVAFLINDPVGDFIAISDKNLRFEITKILFEYTGCRYDIGYNFDNNRWLFDACKFIVDDSRVLKTVYKQITDYLNYGIVYDTGKYFDSNYHFDYVKIFSDYPIVNITKQIFEEYKLNSSSKITVFSTLNNETYSVSDNINKIGHKMENDDVEVIEVVLHTPTKNINEPYSVDENFEQRVNKILENENINVNTVVRRIPTRTLTDTISIDDSNITINVYH